MSYIYIYSGKVNGCKRVKIKIFDLIEAVQSERKRNGELVMKYYLLLVHVNETEMNKLSYVR